MRPEDALAAAHAGADAIGIVFDPPAKRYVAPESAKRILAALPPFVTPVGLFVDAPVENIRGIARLLGLRHVQLHGREDVQCVRRLEGFAIIKAIRVDRQTFSAELARWRDAIRAGLPNLCGIVLETATSAPGGSGQANDWKLIAQARANGEFDGLPPIIAATPAARSRRQRSPPARPPATPTAGRRSTVTPAGSPAPSPGSSI